MSNDGERIAKLEQLTTDMKEDLNNITSVVVNIRDNHLHTIERKLDWYAGGIAAIAFFGGILLQLYK